MGLTRFPHGLSSLGIPLYGDNEVPFMGNTYWVKKATDTDYSTFLNKYNQQYPDGTYSVHATADSVFAAAGKYARIIFMTPDSGGHDLTNVITIGSSQFGLRVYGEAVSPYTQRTMIKNPTTAASVNMFIIKTDKVEFANLTLQNRKAGSCIIIGDATSGAGTAVYQTYIHDCNLTDYGGVALYGITPGAVAAAANDQCDAVNLVVENCYISGFVTAGIVVNGTRSAYIGNQIETGGGGAACGIKVYSSSGSRGATTIKDNYIVSPATATTIGILVSTIGHAADTFYIWNNRFSGGTTAAQQITVCTNTQGAGNAYAADDGTFTVFDIKT